MKNRRISLCLAVAMVIAMLPVTARATQRNTVFSYGDGIKRLATVERKTDSETGSRITGITELSHDGTLVERQYSFHYDDEGRITQIDHTYYDEGSEPRCVATVIEYDSEGRLLSNITGNQDEPWSTYGTEYTYNSAGLLISELSWEGGAVETKYYYDSIGNCIQTVEISDIGVKTTTHEYNENGLRIHSGSEYKEEWNEYYETSTIRYSYNSENLLTKKDITTQSDSKWNGKETTSSTESYVYDEMRRLSKVTISQNGSITVRTYNYSCASVTICEETVDGKKTGSVLQIKDDTGETKFTLFLYAPEYIIDSDELTLAFDTETRYNGETKVSLYEFAYEIERIPSTYSLADLEPADYMALSSLVYKNFGEEDVAKFNESGEIIAGSGKTVREYLKDSWNNNWEDTSIKYSELYKRVADWKICYHKENTNNGFYAVAFQNERNEVIIAYRGSKPLKSVLDVFKSEDAFNDWIKNDIGMIVFNGIWGNNQITDAFEMYGDINTLFAPKDLVVTGHSLGGGLGNLVSAATGCNAETFNAISVLDVAYFRFPSSFGLRFNGVDLWNIQDHANQYDVLAGVFEETFSTQVKPYAAYKSHNAFELVVDNIVKNHGLASFVEKNAEGDVSLTKRMYYFGPRHSISKQLSSVLPWGKAAIDLGISWDDVLALGLTQDVSRSSYGGDGDDIIKTSMWDDSLIGGRGNDNLDGGWGDDRYYYFEGDGVDLIFDASGDDRLYLYGFSGSDSIEANVSSKDTSYIDVSCNGEVIARIYRDNRAYSLATLDNFKICVYQADQEIAEHDITSLFNRKNYDKRYVISCPVNVEIMDAQGNVIYILEDGVTGSFYTEYGNFCVFEEENGEYGKVLDLVEGYSARVVGVDGGTMTASFWEVEDGVLTEEKTVSEIPVAEGYTATVDADDNGEILLVTESVGSHVHAWDKGVVTAEATCEKTGTVLYTCTDNSRHTMYASIPAVDHSYENGKCRFCSQEAPETIPGDEEGDGKVTFQDALTVLRIVIKLIRKCKIGIWW